MTWHEMLALSVAGVVLALIVAGVVIHYWVLARWWWPVVGSAWRAERHRVRLAQAAWNDVWQDEDRCAGCREPAPFHRPRCSFMPVIHAAEPDWDQLDPDSQAEQLIAEWHQEPAPTEPWVYIPDRNTWRWQDDPDLIVYDAKWQAARCREIVHVEFPRLRRELLAA